MPNYRSNTQCTCHPPLLCVRKKILWNLGPQSCACASSLDGCRLAWQLIRCISANLVRLRPHYHGGAFPGGLTTTRSSAHHVHLIFLRRHAAAIQARGARTLLWTQGPHNFLLRVQPPCSVPAPPCAMRPSATTWRSAHTLNSNWSLLEVLM